MTIFNNVIFSFAHNQLWTNTVPTEVLTESIQFDHWYSNPVAPWRISLTTYNSWPEHKHCLVTVITGNGTRIFNTTVKTGPHLVQIPRELNGGHVLILCYTCSYQFHCAWCLQRCEVVCVCIILMSLKCF